MLLITQGYGSSGSVIGQGYSAGEAAPEPPFRLLTLTLGLTNRQTLSLAGNFVPGLPGDAILQESGGFILLQDGIGHMIQEGIHGGGRQADLRLATPAAHTLVLSGNG